MSHLLLFNLHNTLGNVFYIVFAALIAKAIYMIFQNLMQNTGKQRLALFVWLKRFLIFIILPAYILVIIFSIVDAAFWTERTTLNNIYWKIICVIASLTCIFLILIGSIPNINKALRFLKKKDRNEVKYQSIYKKNRTFIIVIVVIDIMLLYFLNGLW